MSIADEIPSDSASATHDLKVTWIQFLEAKNLFEVQSISSASKKSERKGRKDYNLECNHYVTIYMIIYVTSSQKLSATLSSKLQALPQ